MTTIEGKVPMEDYTEIVQEFKEKIVPQILKADMLPGHTRATLTQVEKHILKLPSSSPGDDLSTILFAYGVILGETLIKTVKGAEWAFEAPSLEYLRIKLPMKMDNGESLYAMPVKRVFALYQTKKVSQKGIIKYYDSLLKENKSSLII